MSTKTKNLRPPKRFYCEGRLSVSETVILGQEQTHRLKDVLRFSVGDNLHLFNGQDGEWLCTLNKILKSSSELIVLKQIKQQTSEIDCWLCFAPIKRGHQDFMIEKVTELGATTFLPTFTKRTLVDDPNLGRFTRIAIEAAEQCERLSIPQFLQPQKLPNLLSDWPQDRTLLWCAEAGNAKPMVDALHGSAVKTKAAILIGPEGGFDEQENAMLARHPGIVPISLGPRILRADTAAIAALSVFQATMGDARTPHPPRHTYLSPE